MQSQSHLSSTTKLGADDRGTCGCSPKLIRATIHAIVPEFCCGQSIGSCCCNQLQATIGGATNPISRNVDGSNCEKVDCLTQTRETGIISSDELQCLCQGLRNARINECGENAEERINESENQESAEITDLFNCRRKSTRFSSSRQPNCGTIAEEHESGIPSQTPFHYGQNSPNRGCRPTCKMYKKKKNKASQPSAQDVSLCPKTSSCTINSSTNFRGGGKSIQTSESLFNDGCCERSKCGCHKKQKKPKKKKKKKEKREKKRCPHCKQCEQKKCSIM